MKMLCAFVFFFLFSLLSFGAIDEVINYKKVNWNDKVDAVEYIVYCEVSGNEMNYTSPNVIVVPSELLLNTDLIRANLGIVTEGETYDLCVVSVDASNQKSKCSNVVSYFFDITPPPVPDGVVIEDI